MNKAKFDGMGDIYAQYRPSYPQAFIDFIYSDDVGIQTNSVIADIGSGTGILTRQILDQGNKVFAVEPNTDMRASAQADLGGFDHFVSIDGAAESTTLSDHSVDFITVAQAFHWFDRRAFKAECRRILRSGGKVILVWNSRAEESDMIRENYEICRKYCPNFKGFSGGMRGADGEGHFHDFFAGEYVTKNIDHDLAFDQQGFIGRNLSSSYALKEHDENYADYVAELKCLFHKYSENGILIMPNITQCFVGGV